MGRKRTDLTGRKYDRLIVLKFSRYGETLKGRRRAYWLCQCSCGNEVEVEVCRLKMGLRSCGCLMTEIGIKTTKVLNDAYYQHMESGEADFNRLLNSYKQRAKRKNLDFSLTKDQFKAFTSRDCYYCGSSPTQGLPKNPSPNGAYLHNGIDRVESSNGYSPDNCVSCCKVCNRAKNTMSITDFEKWLDVLASFRAVLVYRAVA